LAEYSGSVDMSPEGAKLIISGGSRRHRSCHESE
jgi:hypothetical protein